MLLTDNSYLCVLGKSRKVPLPQVLSSTCCVVACLSLIAFPVVQEARQRFEAKTLYEQRSWIMDYLKSTSQRADDGTFEYAFLVGVTAVCCTAWRYAYGITKRRFHYIKQRFERKYWCSWQA